MEEGQKFRNLDGLRGLAALFVMLGHYTLAFLPFLVGAYATSRHTPIDKLVSNTPLFLPFAGAFCVYVFFILSGFVLSLSFFRKRTTTVLISSAARRYFRLMVPAFGSVILAYIALAIFGSRHHDIAAGLTQSPWLATFWNFPPNLFSAVYQGAYGVFFKGVVSYNPNLWTMQYELYGSFLIFMFLALFGKLQRRWALYGVFTLILLKTSLLAFLVGVALCDVWVNYPQLKNQISDRAAVGLLAIGICLGSWNIHNVYRPFYVAFHLPFFTVADTQLLGFTIGAACIIIAVLRLSWLARFFESRALQYLGKISFSLYLIHFIVLYSLSSYLFNVLLPHVGYIISFSLMFSISAPIIFGISTLYANYVDAAAIRWSKTAGNWLLATNKKHVAIQEPEAEPNVAPGLIVSAE